METYQTHFGDLAEGLLGIIKDAGITDTVFFEAGPDALQNPPEAFCNVIFPLTVRSKGPYQLHDVRVDFIRKDMPHNKRTDLKGLETMVNRWLALFPIRFGRFTLDNPYIRLKGKDGLGHSSWTVQCDCLVNTTEKYATDDGSTATT